MRDLEMKMEHALFLLREYRQLRLCDHCAEIADIDPALREVFGEENGKE